MTSASQIVREQSPHLTEISARVTAHRMLTDIHTRPELAQELAKIMPPDEVKELITEIARSKKERTPDRLKGLELMGKVHAILTDRTVNENLNTDMTAEALAKAAEEAIKGITETPSSVGEGRVSSLPATQNDTVNK